MVLRQLASGAKCLSEGGAHHSCSGTEWPRHRFGDASFKNGCPVERYLINFSPSGHLTTSPFRSGIKF